MALRENGRVHVSSYGTPFAPRTGMKTDEKHLGANRIEGSQSSRALQTLTLAFGSDPVARWCWPEARDYLAAFPQFAAAFGGRAIRAESAFEVAAFGGAALWLPPGESPDEETLGELVHSTVPAEKRPALFSLLTQMGEHHPSDAHWYLPLIGVDPAMQGRGLGQLLMEPILKRCDRAGLLAYLESSNPKNINFYERLGFAITAELEIDGGPTLVPMLRTPR
jgi:ribosomal protein S18 acetylase RimI-like enzyme